MTDDVRQIRNVSCEHERISRATPRTLPSAEPNSRLTTSQARSLVACRRPNSGAQRGASTSMHPSSSSLHSLAGVSRPAGEWRRLSSRNDHADRNDRRAGSCADHRSPDGRLTTSRCHHRSIARLPRDAGGRTQQRKSNGPSPHLASYRLDTPTASPVARADGRIVGEGRKTTFLLP